MNIRQEHIDALENSMEATEKEEILGRLRDQFPPETTAMGDNNLRRLVDESYDDAKGLDIRQLENIYRFTKLNFLPPRFKKSPFIQSVLIRILNNRNLSGHDRLDLVERNVVNRQFTDAELRGEHST